MGDMDPSGDVTAVRGEAYSLRVGDDYILGMANYLGRDSSANHIFHFPGESQIAYCRTLRREPAWFANAISTNQICLARRRDLTEEQIRELRELGLAA